MPFCSEHVHRLGPGKVIKETTKFLKEEFGSEAMTLLPQD
jgi:hypothetical protein